MSAGTVASHALVAATGSKDFTVSVVAGIEGLERRSGLFVVERCVEAGANIAAVRSVTVAGGSGPEGSGQFVWYNFAQIDAMSMVHDMASTPEVNDQMALRQYAARIQDVE